MTAHAAALAPAAVQPDARLNSAMTTPATIAPLTSNDSVLRVEGLTVSFDGFKAVDDLNLEVAKNELRVVIGPNGAGKTTLLDMICGKTRPTAGRVLFKGQDPILLF